MRDTSARLKQTKDAIAEALVALIENNNYNEITIQEIASGCSISRRTEYRHFKTKDEILRYSFRSCLQKLADYISLSDTQDLHKLCLTYFKFWEENMDRLLMMNDAGVLFSFVSEFDAIGSVIADRMMSRSAFARQATSAESVSLSPKVPLCMISVVDTESFSLMTGIILISSSVSIVFVTLALVSLSVMPSFVRRIWPQR
mgnify:CR=1 FL=1